MQPGGIGEQQGAGGQARFERPRVQIVTGQQTGRGSTVAGQVPRAAAAKALPRCRASTCRCRAGAVVGQVVLQRRCSRRAGAV
jgi:hypothetical protein